MKYDEEKQVVSVFSNNTNFTGIYELEMTARFNKNLQYP
jgi:hypothetical protein